MDGKCLNGFGGARECGTISLEVCGWERIAVRILLDPIYVRTA